VIKKFIELIEFVLNHCGNFFKLGEKGNYLQILNLFLQFLSFGDHKWLSSFEFLKLYPNLRYEVKNLQLKLMKDMPKLLNEVETNFFIAFWNRVNIGFEMLNQQGFIPYTASETNMIFKALQEGFRINLKNQIIVNDNLAFWDLETLKKKELTQAYITEISHQHAQAFMKFIVEYLPITNFEEEVFKTILKMFSLIPRELSVVIVESIYSNLIENKFTRVEEALTNLMLLSFILENSKNDSFPISAILESFLDNPFQNIEASGNLSLKEQKIFIEYFTTNIVFSCYQVRLYLD